MKKNKWKIFAAAICIMSVLGIYAFFHVSGGEIQGAKEISSDCKVTIEAFPFLKEEEKTTIVLNSDNIQKLKTLILESHFQRRLQHMVRVNDRDCFRIRVDYPDEREPLKMDCIGNEYVLITKQFGGHHLKVKNSRWKETITQIMRENTK